MGIFIHNDQKCTRNIIYEIEIEHAFCLLATATNAGMTNVQNETKQDILSFLVCHYFRISLGRDKNEWEKLSKITPNSAINKTRRG